MMNKSISFYFNYFLENFKISFKSLVEFKTNLYNLLLIELFIAISFVTISLVLSSNFGILINWSALDFLLSYYISSLIKDTSGLLYFNKGLSYRIKDGGLNPILTKPGNPFLMFILGYSFNTIIPIILYFSIIIIILFFINPTWISLILFLLLFLLGLFLMIIFYHFLSSFSFYLIELGQILLSNIFSKVNEVPLSYPYQFFGESIHKVFLLIFPLFLTSSIIIPILNGNTIDNLILKFLVLSFSGLICLLGLLINWKIGLKKYEAFG